MTGFFLIALGALCIGLWLRLLITSTEGGKTSPSKVESPIDEIAVSQLIVKKTYRICQGMPANDQQRGGDSGTDTFAGEDRVAVNKDPSDSLPRDSGREYSETSHEEYSSYVSTAAFEGEELSELDSDIMERQIQQNMIVSSRQIVSAYLDKIPDEEDGLQNIFEATPEQWEEMDSYF